MIGRRQRRRTAVLPRSARSRRRGVIILEFILAMPVLFIATLAIFEFGFLALVQQSSTTAVTEGSREGAKMFPPALPLDAAGSNNDIVDQIVLVMNQYLAVQSMEIADTANGFPDTTRANVFIRVERGDGGVGFITVDRGTLPPGFACNRKGPDPSGQEIIVTLCFPLVDSNDPSNPRPVPDWLSSFGFSLKTYEFQLSARSPFE